MAWQRVKGRRSVGTLTWVNFNLESPMGAVYTGGLTDLNFGANFVMASLTATAFIFMRLIRQWALRGMTESFSTGEWKGLENSCGPTVGATKGISGQIERTEKER